MRLIGHVILGLVTSALQLSGISNKLKRLFYPLTFLQFSCLLCKIPKKSRKTLLSFNTFIGGFLTFSSKLDGNYRDRLMKLPTLIKFWSACLVVWSANFIAELFKDIYSQRGLLIGKWSYQNKVFANEVDKIKLLRLINVE